MCLAATVPVPVQLQNFTPFERAGWDWYSCLEYIRWSRVFVRHVARLLQQPAHVQDENKKIMQRRVRFDSIAWLLKREIASVARASTSSNGEATG